MCTGKYAKFIENFLFLLGIISIVCNVIQLFPNSETAPVRNPGEQMTPEVLYLGGIIGGGLLVLIPAIRMRMIRKGSSSSPNVTLSSIIYAAIGVAGSLYGLVVSVVGMVRGPQCIYLSLINGFRFVWGRPFYFEYFSGDESFLFHSDTWDICIYPQHVVSFNITLFSMVIASTSISLILWSYQMFRGLLGFLRGTGQNEN